MLIFILQPYVFDDMATMVDPVPVTSMRTLDAWGDLHLGPLDAQYDLECIPLPPETSYVICHCDESVAILYVMSIYSCVSSEVHCA